MQCFAVHIVMLRFFTVDEYCESVLPSAQFLDLTVALLLQC